MNLNPRNDSRFEVSRNPGLDTLLRSGRLLAILSLCLATSAPLAAQTSYTGMVSFGDSLSDVGNTVSALTESEARDLTGYNSNFYASGRFSNGPIWVDDLYASLGFGAVGTMTYNNNITATNGTNFAWAGARSGTGYRTALIPNLQTQVGYYTSQLGVLNPALGNPSTTLFTVWSGGNDVLASVEENDPVTPAQVVANVAAAITNLYGAGGRSFLVPNLPPIGLSPDYVNDPVKGPEATAFTNDFNDELKLSLDALSSSLTGIDIIKLDVNQLFLNATNDPAASGLLNVTDKAYIPISGTNPPFPYGSVAANPNGYLYWDSADGTTAANALIGEAAYQAVVVPEPATWTLLLVGGIALLFFARKRHPIHPTL